MIGDDWPAQKVKDGKPSDVKEFFNKVVENMRKLNKAGLVHGDLSEYNILTKNETPYFIDFSQCTELNSTIANDLFERDVKNMERFFKKLGLKITEQDIKSKILK